MKHNFIKMEFDIMAGNPGYLLSGMIHSRGAKIGIKKKTVVARV